MSKQKIADALTERSQWVRIGALTFRQRPLTLAQIYTIGAHIEPMAQLQLEDGVEIAPVVEMLNKYEDMRICQQIALDMLFRSRVMRKIFSRYIKHNLTMAAYQRIISKGSESLSATFFLTHLTFLKGVSEVTKKTNIQEVTPRGDLSAE